MWGSRAKLAMPSKDKALPGRSERMRVPAAHFVNRRPLTGPFPEGLETAMFGLGCFWGAERKFWEAPGVFTTAVGYAAGYTPNPTYEEVCTGLTGHNEAVLVVFDPNRVSYDGILKISGRSHAPTKGRGQGKEVGTQYRSGIYVSTPSSDVRPRHHVTRTSACCRRPATARSRRRSSTRR